jgi:hypothetical protein
MLSMVVMYFQFYTHRFVKFRSFVECQNLLFCGPPQAWLLLRRELLSKICNGGQKPRLLPLDDVITRF